LHDHIVGAHRHEVYPDRVMPPGVDREPQFRAHAIGAGDQHRAFVAGRQFHQCAEAADAGEHLAALRAAHQGLDAFDEFIAGVDVDTRIAVGDAVISHDSSRNPGWAAVGCGGLWYCTRRFALLRIPYKQ
jgi:hypothetical protein